MRNARVSALFAFLALQAVLVAFGVKGEYLPPKPDFARFPRALHGWSAQGEVPMEAGVLDVVHADAVLSRVYTETGTPWSAQLLVVWFQSQRGGRSQPHSPKVCLPASGWLPVKSDTIRIKDLEVNRLIATSSSSRGVVFYWYQTPFRTVASEWAAKFWVMADSLHHGRTDAALVRVFVPVAAGGDEAASAAAVRFVESARAELDRRIPR